MSQHDNTEELYEHKSSGSSHHHHSSGSSGHHHSSSSSSHHHSSGSSSHHSSGSSSHHHSSDSSSHHSSSSSSHHSSGSSSRHHSSKSSKHHSSSSSKSNYYYSESSEKEKQLAEEKIRRLGEKFSQTEERDDVYFSTGQNTESIAAAGAVKRKKKKKKNKALQVILGIFLFFFSLILIAAVALMIMIATGKKDMLDYSDADIEVIADAETDNDGKTVRYNGKIYQLNEDITSIACLGVDKEEINANGIVGAAGQADTVIVIAFDTKTGMAKLIPIPRDTVAEIDVYAKDGSFLRTEKTQLCLAYAYGDGGKTSCENVISSIKKVMFGMPIHCYAALDLAGIGPVNDSIGGVTLTPGDSFAMFEAGRPVHLMGDTAVTYVRARDTDKVDSNLVRMNHQLHYIKSFTRTAASQAMKSPSMITDVYNVAMKYAFTDIDLSKATYIASRFMTLGGSEFLPVSVPGKMISGEDGYSEYYIDEKGFYEAILSVYYNVTGTY